MSGFVPGRRNR